MANYSARMQQQNAMPHQYNGVAIMNQVTRLTFYDQILKECKGKRCIDVGSGSGVLAFLALKHGAKHVTCFEQNPTSANHIRNVAKKMGLSKKIDVINDEFIASKLNDYPIQKLNEIQVLFHELIGSIIWDDMMGNAFDVPLPFKMIPNEYLISFYIVKLTQKQYGALINAENNPGIQQWVSDKLTTELGLSNQFADYYNDVIESAEHYHHNIHRIGTTRNISGVRSITNQIYVNNQFDYIGTHLFDYNQPDHFKTRNVIQFALPQIDDPYLIVFAPVLKSGNHKFEFSKYPDDFTGFYNPIIVHSNSNVKALRYDLFNGKFRVDNMQI